MFFFLEVVRAVLVDRGRSDGPSGGGLHSTGVARIGPGDLLLERGHPDWPGRSSVREGSLKWALEELCPGRELGGGCDRHGRPGWPSGGSVRQRSPGLALRGPLLDRGRLN